MGIKDDGMHTVLYEFPILSYILIIRCVIFFPLSHDIGICPIFLFVNYNLVYFFYPFPLSLMNHIVGQKIYSKSSYYFCFIFSPLFFFF